MNLIRHDDNMIIISLSRRNLETGIRMLDQQVSIPFIHRNMDEGGIYLQIRFEEDAEHYHSEDRNESSRGNMGVGPDGRGPFHAPKPK